MGPLDQLGGLTEQSTAVTGEKHGRGRKRGSSNLHSKQPSGIAQRLKHAGVDWVVDFAAAIKTNDLIRINMWMRLLPYLVVTHGHQRAKKPRGNASKAALAALEALEQND